MSQTHHGILIHAIFSTKHRSPTIADEWRDDLFGYIGGTLREHKASLLSAGGIEDHVHLFLKIHPSFAIADTIRHPKANSSRWINSERKVNARFEWQRGYAAFSVSQSMSDTVKRYIKNQRAHHQTASFEAEYLEFLRRHRIEFDQKYVFDGEFVA